MKIVQINTVLGTGSTGKITKSLYESCVENGIDAYVAYGRGKKSRNAHMIKIGSGVDFLCHVLYNFLWDKSGFGSEKKTRKFLEQLDEIKPDLIHLHNIHGFYLQTELLFQYIREKGIPVVWTLHDCWPITGHCAFFDYVECEKWKTGCHHCVQQRSSYPYALFCDNSRKNYQQKKAAYTGILNLVLVTPSHWLKEVVKNSYLKEYPVRVIQNGIDTDIFKPSREPISHNFGEQWELLGVANIWEKRKGFDFLLQLIEELPEAYHLTIVGAGKKQEKEIEKRNLINRVTVISRTENQQALAKLYQRADVYVNTTLEDNFPTTNLEALASGTPVVTFETGGSPECLAGDRLLGRTVKKGNIKELVKAVIEITAEKKPWEACAARGKDFQKENSNRAYISLYREMWEKNELKGIHYHNEL